MILPCKPIPHFDIEDSYQSNLIIAGVDEAGRGPLAGPVVTAAVIVDRKNIIQGVNDSKKISKNLREKLFQKITGAYCYSVGIVSAAEIDQINILEATKKACRLAVEGLQIAPHVILVDGNMKFSDKRFVSIIKGDALSYSIAAASIIAKVTRDNIMLSLANEFPEYGWEQNVGYGTKHHINSIKNFGLSPHHRRSFRVKD